MIALRVSTAVLILGSLLIGHANADSACTL